MFFDHIHPNKMQMATINHTLFYPNNQLITAIPVESVKHDQIRLRIHDIYFDETRSSFTICFVSEMRHYLTCVRQKEGLWREIVSSKFSVSDKTLDMIYERTMEKGIDYVIQTGNLLAMKK